MSKFCRFELLTTDPEGARAFYRALFGHDRAAIWPLHEQARAHGAPPHWLGHLAVDDVESTTAQLVERGATRLGPTRPTYDGGRAAVFLDPGGAKMAVSTPPAAGFDCGVDVVWHVLNTRNAEAAQKNYRELFGFSLGRRIDRGPSGVFDEFAWDEGGAAVGVIGDLDGRPGVHPHWLFFFAVESLDASARAVREAGGLALEPIRLPSGVQLCACDDPQGAAFGLLERPATR